MGFLNKYQLINENQSGFRPKHSCQTALIKLIDQWMTCINKGDIVGTLFLDFRKAFDLVDHSILLKKLSTYKFNNSSQQLFASYLQDRQQVIDNGKGMTSTSKHKIWSATRFHFRPDIIFDVYKRFAFIYGTLRGRLLCRRYDNSYKCKDKIRSRN